MKKILEPSKKRKALFVYSKKEWRINWHLKNIFTICQFSSYKLACLLFCKLKNSYSGILYVSLSIRNQGKFMFINHFNIYIQPLKVKVIQKSQRAVWRHKNVRAKVKLTKSTHKKSSWHTYSTNKNKHFKLC